MSDVDNHPLIIGKIEFNATEKAALDAFWQKFREKDLLPLKLIPSITPKIELRKGWICPKCDAVVSPDEKTCPNCKPKKPKEESDGSGNKTHIQES